MGITYINIKCLRRSIKMNVTVIDSKTMQEDTPAQSLAKMRILDFLIMADDPSFKSVYTMNEMIRKYNIVAWFKEHEPGYYWTDQQMVDNEKEL